MLRSMISMIRCKEQKNIKYIDMGANFLLKKNAGISLSAEGVFIAITTWANQQVPHVLILWDSGKRPHLIKSVRGGVSGRGDLVSYVFILIGYLFYFK